MFQGLSNVAIGRDVNGIVYMQKHGYEEMPFVVKYRRLCPQPWDLIVVQVIFRSTREDNSKSKLIGVTPRGRLALIQ